MYSCEISDKTLFQTKLANKIFRVLNNDRIIRVALNNKNLASSFKSTEISTPVYGDCSPRSPPNSSSTHGSTSLNVYVQSLECHFKANSLLIFLYDYKDLLLICFV